MSIPFLANLTELIKRKMKHVVDLAPICNQLPNVIAPTGVRLACIHVGIDDQEHQKTLIGTSLTYLEPHSNESSNAGPSSINGLPTRLAMSEPNDIDKVGKDTMFSIGSLFETFLALLCCILVETQVYEQLTWTTHVFQYARRIFPGFSFDENGPYSNTTLRELLLHTNGLPAVNNHDFLSDGIFQRSGEDFATLLNDLCKPNQGENRSVNGQEKLYQYSLANYIFISRLLEEVSRKSIDDLMREHLFDPIGMNRTTLDLGRVNTSDDNTAEGQRVSIDLRTHTKAPRNYEASTASIVPVGGLSCTDDIAKLCLQLLAATHDRPSIFTKKIVVEFFARYGFQVASPDHPDQLLSFAGNISRLTDRYPGWRSLNREVREQLRSEKPPPPPRKFAQDPISAEDRLYYLGSTSDGFTCAVYLFLSAPSFAIVLANAAGPVEVAEPVARYLVNSAIYSRYGFATTGVKHDLIAEIAAQRNVCLSGYSLESNSNLQHGRTN